MERAYCIIQSMNENEHARKSIRLLSPTIRQMRTRKFTIAVSRIKSETRGREHKGRHHEAATSAGIEEGKKGKTNFPPWHRTHWKRKQSAGKKRGKSKPDTDKLSRIWRRTGPSWSFFNIFYPVKGLENFRHASTGTSSATSASLREREGSAAASSSWERISQSVDDPSTQRRNLDTLFRHDGKTEFCRKLLPRRGKQATFALISIKPAPSLDFRMDARALFLSNALCR